jgi:uncharacterized protein YaaR (DUF327 family)
LKIKLKTLKQQVYQLAGVIDTKQLKKQHPNLTKGRDLRQKANWQEIFNQLTADEKPDQIADMFDHLLAKGNYHGASRLLIQQGENAKAAIRAKADAAIAKILSM